MILSKSPTDSEILALIDCWVDDLVREDYHTAYSRTDHDPCYSWTPDLIRAVIEGYGLPEPHPCGEIFRVTARQTATGKQHYRTVDRTHIPQTSIAEVWYDLPLNGGWSDLTVTFRVEPRDAATVLVLEQIHVF
ncbi:MAG: hypothetical protein OHK0012_22890 [Synechococcales cyanobacterium]